MSSAPAPLLPGVTTARGQPATLGVMGGGQLGRLFVQAAQALGYCTAVLDPDPASPAGQVSHWHIQTDYEDEQGLAQLMQRCDAITTEFENIPAAVLHTLAAHRVLAPSASAVAIAQDRLQEKALFARVAQRAARSGQTAIGPAPHAPVCSERDLHAIPPTLLPGILKTARLGYDGKGQVRVDHPSELPAAWQQLGRVPCVLEQRLPLQAECSIVLARSADGHTVHLPPQRNLHRHGILALTEVSEENLPPSLFQQAMNAAVSIAEELHYVGVLCVEFFIVDDGSPAGALVVNEMAPRPHNSGHHSLDSCSHSQFELQVRALAGLPLVQPRLLAPALMLNLLGDLWYTPDGQPRTPDWGAILALPGAHLHLYGKLQPRPGRKMGHLTLTGSSPAEARAQALEACRILGLPGF